MPSFKKKKHRAPYRTLGESPSFLMDPVRRRVVVVGSRLLRTQFERDARRVEASFDRVAKEDVGAIDSLYSLTMAHAFSARNQLEASTHRGHAVHLLMQVGHALGAALHLTRGGYRLQPGGVLRGAIEQIAIAFQLFQDPDSVAQYEQEQLSSAKAISIAKAIFPPLGRYYAMLSSNFVHVGALHRELNPLVPYDADDPALWTNLANIRLVTWLFYVSTELICYEFVVQHRYWQRVEGGFKYAPDLEEKQWMARFLKSDEV